MTRWERLRVKVFLFLAGFFRRMTLGVRAALIDGDKVLLIRHTYVPGWQFPGGGIETGENALLSLEREVLEETGMRLTGPATLFGFYHNRKTSARDHVALYVCRSFAQERVFKPNAEIAEIGWFPLTELPDHTTDGTRRRVREIVEGLDPAPEW